MSNYAVAYRVQDAAPWIGLPAAKLDANASIDDMARSANLLGWNVHLREIVTDARSDKASFEVLRTDPFAGDLHRLSICGERYVEVQNEDILDLARNITDGDVKCDSAGAFNNGRNVFFSFTLGENIVLDPNGSADEIGRYLNIMTSHDGSSSIVAFTGNLRLRCQNMLTSAKSAALSTFKMRHTQSVEGRLLDARKALGIAFKASEAFEAEMQALVEAEMRKDQFWALVKDVFPQPEADVRGSLRKWETKTEQIMSLWNGDTVANLDNNAYKAYNVLNENLMWYTSIRAGNVENALVRASGFDEAANKRNLDLYRRTLAHAG